MYAASPTPPGHVRGRRADAGGPLALEDLLGAGPVIGVVIGGAGLRLAAPSSYRDGSRRRLPSGPS